MASSAVLMSSFELMARTISRASDRLRIADPPRLLTVARWPRHHGEVAMDSGLEEPSAARLLDRDEATAEVLDVPALTVVVLPRTRDHTEVQADRLVRVEEAAAAGLLDGDHTTAEIG